MDHAWAIQKLDEFIADVDRLNAFVHLRSDVEALVRKEALIRKIANAYQEGAGDYAASAGNGKQRRWGPARHAALLARELATNAEDFEAFRRPKSASVTTEAMHPWVQKSVTELWAANAHQDAVLAAARTVNRRLQEKLKRHDVGDNVLCMQSFGISDPEPGKPRLRFPGDRTTPSWRARQDGAKYLSAGAFLGIRNLAAHEEKVPWGQQEALEYLATFSVVSRWIEECTVETAS
ncbi:TIGR02391 family protein [Streptomyces sp. NPDC059373]